VASVARHLGWAAPFRLIGVLGLLIAVLVAARLPRGLSTPPVDLKAWLTLVRTPSVRLLLLLTVLLTAGQFVVFTFVGPVLARLAHATPEHIGLVFASFGFSGFVGNVFASRVVSRWGPFRTSLAAVLAMWVGILFWVGGAGVFLVMAFGTTIWGLGFASSNSMQQARLAATAPMLAGAAVALNSSSLYVGQALGSAIGGALFERGLDRMLGYGALAFMSSGLLVLAATRPVRSDASALHTLPAPRSTGI
jgi:predicted MFS family arabinose efflux permease